MKRLDFVETFVLDVDIVIVGNRIQTNHTDVLDIVEQTLYQVGANETSSTCDKHRLAFETDIILKHKNVG